VKARFPQAILPTAGAPRNSETLLHRGHRYSHTICLGEPDIDLFIIKDGILIKTLPRDFKVFRIFFDEPDSAFSRYRPDALVSFCFPASAPFLSGGFSGESSF